MHGDHTNCNESVKISGGPTAVPTYQPELGCYSALLLRVSYQMMGTGVHTPAHLGTQ